ncbi:hypothetical protein H8E07_12880 [bacterium]|nr:hypothetical protein [bacterium]
MARNGFDMHKLFIVVLGLAAAALVLWVVRNGLDFYTTPLIDRPHNPDYREFRPAGRVGHGIGILGSLMIIMLLLYSLRKRSALMRNWGNIGHWLRYHIFLGVAGPILITLHTSFKFQGLVSVSYWSMVAVALSGVFGRYLYQQLPRNVLGEQMAPGTADERREEILVLLSEDPAFNDATLARLEALALDRLEGRSAPIALLRLPLLNAALVSQLHSRMSGVRGTAFDLAREWVLLTRRLHLFNAVRDLFHWWHVFHKPFAVIMILVMIVHVGVTVVLGYTWIW